MLNCSGFIYNYVVKFVEVNFCFFRNISVIFYKEIVIKWVRCVINFFKENYFGFFK